MSTTRLPQNSSLQFHTGTEDDLANFVVKSAKEDDANSVIKAVDDFCWNNHWMMHVGDVKGGIVDKVIEEYKPKIILELGTYCGYSAVRMARLLPTDGELWTIDPVPRKAAATLVNHAGMDMKIRFMTGTALGVIPLLDHLKGKIDMVFIDHAKDKYLSDLKLIEKYGLLHSGSVIVADNVIIFQINDYLEHVRNKTKYSSSVNHKATLEYDNSGKEDMVDGIEVSVWKAA